MAGQSERNMDLDQKDNPYIVDLTSTNTSITSVTEIADFDWSNMTISSNTSYTPTGGLLTGANGVTAAEINQGGRLSLHGDNADIEINGESLMGTLRNIQDHLNVLRPDPQLEAEWDELAEIRRQYESKLSEYREKSKAWKILKS